MGELLKEFGVYYSRGPGPGLRKYNYIVRMDKDRNYKRIGTVYCSNMEDFHKLITFWNLDKKWHYYTLAESK